MTQSTFTRKEPRPVYRPTNADLDWSNPKYPGVYTCREPQAEAEPRPPSRMRESESADMIRINGLFVFTPESVSRDDVREFMYEGLRLLVDIAKQKGLSDNQLRTLIRDAFERFSSTADSVWTELKELARKTAASTPPQETDRAASERLCFAGEEDKPKLIKLRPRLRLKLLDPDQQAQN